jgi:hypothetical protein
MIGDADGLRDEDRALVEDWIDGLTGAIARRLSDRKLKRRLAHITQRRPRLRDRLWRIAGRYRLRAAWQRQSRQHAQALRALDRAVPEATGPATVKADAPTIEQIATELRRLDRQRRSGPATESERWRAAVLRAYDERLRLCCHALGLTEHLEPLEGLDREIERVRVEGELQRSGLRLRAVHDR